jgi:hypothetical protein
MLAVVLILGLGNVLFGELVPAGEGFGWDGVTYAEMVRRLGAMIADGQLSRYYSQRILPSLIVRTGLAVSGADLSNRNIILGFELLNLTALAIGVVVWKRMSEVVSIGPEGQWIGFAGLFLNYFATKHLAYAPVTTDGLALLVSLNDAASTPSAAMAFSCGGRLPAWHRRCGAVGDLRSIASCRKPANVPACARKLAARRAGRQGLYKDSQQHRNDRSWCDDVWTPRSGRQRHGKRRSDLRLH